MRCSETPRGRWPDVRRGVIALLATVGAVVGFAAPPAQAEVAVTVAVSTADGSPPRVDQPVTVSGQVTGTTGPVTVTLERREPGDSAPTQVGMPQDTQPDGSFSFTDQPDKRGAVTYTVTVQPSGPSGSATADVAGLDPHLRLTASTAVVRSGHRVHLTAHLDPATTVRQVTVHAKPYHQDRVTVGTGDTDATTGEFSTRHTVDRRTRFVVTFAGDDRYDPAVDRLVVRARAALDERLRGGYGEAHGFRLYHPSSNPSVTVHLHPVHDRACVFFRAQRRDDGRWHNTAVSDCVHTDADGLARGILTGDHIVGRPYRLRAETHRTTMALAGRGQWLKIRFHR